MPFPFRDLPVQDLEGATRNFEQLSIRGILGEPGEPVAQTRSLATAYRPSFSRPVFVTITLRLEATAATAAAEVKIGPTSPPTILFTNPACGNSNAAAVTARWPVTIPLPPAWFYEVKKIGAEGTVAIEKVFEQVV